MRMVEKRIEPLGEVIEQIIGSGLNEYDIAEHVEASQASINRIRNGKQRPSDELGQKLRRLRDGRCKQEARA
jgi:ribosome-binding protein aMBF1 (putative translation factor)